MMRLIVGIIAGSLASFVNGFSTGAGGCDGNGPAVNGQHLRSESSGALSSLGYEFTINELTVDSSVGAALAVDGFYRLAVSSTDGSNPFKGFLIRVQQGDDSSFITFDPDTSTAQTAAVCGSIPGITHIDNGEKTDAFGFFSTSSSDDDVIIDVTIVQENQVVSVYAYEQFELVITSEPTASPVPALDDDTPTVTPIDEDEDDNDVDDVPTSSPDDSSIVDDLDTVPTATPFVDADIIPTVVPGPTPVPDDDDDDEDDISAPASTPTAVPVDDSTPTAVPIDDATTPTALPVDDVDDATTPTTTPIDSSGTDAPTPASIDDQGDDTIAPASTPTTEPDDLIPSDVPSTIMPQTMDIMDSDPPSSTPRGMIDDDSNEPTSAAAKSLFITISTTTFAAMFVGIMIMLIR